MRLLRLGCAALLLSLAAALPAQSSDPYAPAGQKLLPDIPTLMHEVELRQRQAETVAQSYTYHEEDVFHERNSQGAIKKTEEAAWDVYWIDGVRLRRMIRKNGRDLTPDELKKEDERLGKYVQKAKERRARGDAEDKETDSAGHDEVSAARILAMGSFTNARRELVAGRPTIAVDYQGNPSAKAHSPAESLFRFVNGTVWIDEQDKVLQHAEGRFMQNYKIGAGLIASVRGGTTFQATFALINGEVWLPSHFEVQGEGRFLLFFAFDGDGTIQAGNYRKFKATSTIVGIGDKPSTADDPAPGSSAPAQSQPASPPQ